MAEQDPWRFTYDVGAARDVCRANPVTTAWDLEQLVQEASNNGVFGPHHRITLWWDRLPDGRIEGWHVTVDVPAAAFGVPNGHNLRLAGAWADSTVLWHTNDATGDENVDLLALSRVADEAADVLARSRAAQHGSGQPATSASAIS